MSQELKLTCETCGHVYQLDKTEELPAHVFSMHCNFCPLCEDQATGYYHEWWDEDENDGTPPPPPVPDNQLCMPFIMDEIGVKQVKTETA